MSKSSRMNADDRHKVTAILKRAESCYWAEFSDEIDDDSVYEYSTETACNSLHLSLRRHYPVPSVHVSDMPCKKVLFSIGWMYTYIFARDKLRFALTCHINARARGAHYGKFLYGIVRFRRHTLALRQLRTACLKGI